VSILSFSRRNSPLISAYSYARSVILGVAYGYKIKGRDDTFVNYVEKILDDFTLVLTPGAWMVDLLPIRNLPFNFYRDSKLTIPYQLLGFRDGSLEHISKR
jgi:hypothetical protein